MPSEYVDLNFKTDRHFRHEFRKLAAHHGISGVSLLRSAIAEWRERHGGPAPATSMPTSRLPRLSVVVSVDEVRP